MSAAADLQSIDARQKFRRRGRGITVVGLLVVLAVVAGLGFWGAHWTGDGHRLIYTETLPDGRVFRCFSDGSAIGSAGTEVSTGEAPAAPEGSEGGPAIVVRPPGLNEEEARRAAEEYRRSGRTVEQDEADFDRLSEECERRR